MRENNHIKKDIQTLDQYSIMLCDDTLINHFGCHSTPRKDALFPLKVNDNECLLLPAPEFSALLYRGQNEYFEVCKPTLGPFIIPCQSGKITNTQGTIHEDRNRCRAICS